MIFDYDCPPNAVPEPEVDNLVDVQIGPAGSTDVVIGRIARVHEKEDGSGWTLTIFADATHDQERVVAHVGGVGVKLRDDKVEKVLGEADELKPYDASIN